LHFSAFHPDFKMMDVPRTPPQTLRRARHIARAHGLKYVYTGNVHDPDGQTTTCPGCGTPVVVRDWYVIESYDLTDGGACRQCSTEIPGVYNGPVGTWGSRRMPVRILDALATERGGASSTGPGSE
jgi:pyruvate formate lyase activating enzyme